MKTTPEEPAAFFMNSFLQILKYREENDVKKNDFISLLLSLKQNFTSNQLAGESFLVFTSASTTSSILISFVCYELALNLEIQERLRDEIISCLERNDGQLTYQMLFRMKYLDMVINECLRKYPPIPALVRKCTQEYTLPGTSMTIPKGTAIQLLVYSIHHDPEYYPEPERFDPERFSPENTRKREPFTFMPFSEGPRSCIGLRLGLMQSKLAILKIVKNFELFPSKQTLIPAKLVASSPFVTPKEGMWVKMKKVVL